MPFWTCEQCGAQFPETAAPPPSCPICEDDRQYVNWNGQAWLTREELAKRHRLVWRDDLGVFGIAISHPHYYGAVADWSEAFGGVPIYLHGDDRQWVTRPHPAIVPWSGESQRISDDIVLVRTGGHFAGGTVLHWRGGADGRGALLTGDVATVAMDRRSLSFMYSYPNYIPMNAASVLGIARAVESLAFDRIYGAWWGRNIEAGAKAAFDASVRRYLKAISD